MEELLRVLGLESCADVRVGNPLGEGHQRGPSEEALGRTESGRPGECAAASAGRAHHGAIKTIFVIDLKRLAFLSLLYVALSLHFFRKFSFVARIQRSPRNRRPLKKEIMRGKKRGTF